MSNLPHPPNRENGNDKNRKNNPRFKINRNKTSSPKQKRTIISDLYDEADYGVDHESLVDEKYKLLIEITNLRKEVKKLHNEVIEKDDEIILLDQEDDYLRRKYESYERPHNNEDLKRCISTNLVNLENEFDMANQELKIIRNSFSVYNKRKLLGEIQDQFDELASLKRDNYFLLTDYQSVLNELHSPNLSTLIARYNKNIYDIDQLHQMLEEEQKTELNLNAKIDKMKRQSTVSVRKEMQLEKLQKEYLKISHYRRIRQNEMESAEQRHKQHMNHVTDLKKKQAKIRNEDKERKKFNEAMMDKPKRYISRAPNHIKADNIDYLHGFVKKQDKEDSKFVKSKSSQSQKSLSSKKSKSEISDQANQSTKSHELQNDEEHIEEEEEEKLDIETNQNRENEINQDENGHFEKITNVIGGALLDFDNANDQKEENVEFNHDEKNENESNNLENNNKSEDNELDQEKIEHINHDEDDQSQNVLDKEKIEQITPDEFDNSQNESDKNEKINDESGNESDKEKIGQIHPDEVDKSQNESDKEKIEQTNHDEVDNSQKESDKDEKMNMNDESSGDFNDFETESKKNTLTTTINDIIGKLNDNSVDSDDKKSNDSAALDEIMNSDKGNKANDDKDDVNQDSDNEKETQEKQDSNLQNEKNENHSLRFSDSEGLSLDDKNKATDPQHEDVDDNQYHGGTSIKPAATEEEQENEQNQSKLPQEDSDDDSDIISRPGTPANVKSESPQSNSDDDF